MALSELFPWLHTKEALANLKEILLCFKCKEMLQDPQKFVCGHLVCKQCSGVGYSSNRCPVCHMTTPKCDITSDLLFNNIISGYKMLSDLITNSREDNGNAEANNDSDSNVSSNKHQNAMKSSEKCNSIPTNDHAISADIVPSKCKTVLDRKSTEMQKCTSNKNSDHGKESSVQTENAKMKLKQKINENGSKSSQNHDKRNNKGETQLHVACIKGNRKRVEELLESGANPCTKDNAGWTPLHEASSNGFVDIVQLLLEAGAIVNAPGCYNNTPLHDAALHNHMEIAKLLLLFGADPNLCNIEGSTPRCLARTEGMLDVLKLNLQEKRTPSKMYKKHNTKDVAIILGLGLDSNRQSAVTSFVKHFKLKQASMYSSEVTHVVVEARGQCSELLIPVLHAILQGKWIVSSDWVDSCLMKKELIDPEIFEIKGTHMFPDSKAPTKGRLNKEKLLPSLFNGCHFHLMAGSQFSVYKQPFSRSDVVALIRSGGGIVLKREPDPEAIPSTECTVPYHSYSSGPFAKCSHYIIYQPGIGEPQLKYQMNHVKTLSFDWLIHSIENFALIDA